MASCWRRWYSAGTVLACQWFTICVSLAATDPATGVDILHGGRHARHLNQPENTRHSPTQASSGTPYYVHGKQHNILINPSYDQYRVAVTQVAVKPTPVSDAVVGSPRVYLLNGRPQYVVNQGRQTYPGPDRTDTRTAAEYTAKDGDYKYPISLEGDTIGKDYAKQYGENAGKGDGGSAGTGRFSDRLQDAFNFLQIPGVAQRRAVQDKKDYRPEVDTSAAQGSKGLNQQGPSYSRNEGQRQAPNPSQQFPHNSLPQTFPAQQQTAAPNQQFPQNSLPQTLPGQQHAPITSQQFPQNSLAQTFPGQQQAVTPSQHFPQNPIPQTSQGQQQVPFQNQHLPQNSPPQILPGQQQPPITSQQFPPNSLPQTFSPQFSSGPSLPNLRPDFRTSEQNADDVTRQLSTREDVILVTDCALLEEAASDMTGRTQCLAAKTCSPMRVPKECAGRELTRTSDGTCNNLRQPIWGSAFRPFKRYLPPAYSDGAGNPRTSSVETDAEGRQLPLPSPRLVSRTVHLITDSPSDASMLLMQFGQFVDHDISGTSSTRGPSGAISCCNQAGSLHEACWPIDVPPGDTHYTSTRCINFVRSLPASDHNNVTLVPRQQRNEVTSYLDGSAIYGSSQEQTTKLRSFQRGELRSSDGDLLPLERDGACVTEDGLCLISGDVRVNEVPGLGALHVILHRHHNRLAAQLAAILANDVTIPPAATDEVVFQTARRIVGAQLQHVVYSEWLPLILGQFATEHYGLSNGRYAYDENRDPGVANVFASAAFRFGHSLVPDFLTVGSDTVPLHTTFSDPKLVRTRLEAVLTGLLEGVAQTRDHFFAASLRNHLFELTPRHGLDLVALNIQRGRDHGLPSYQKWRAACGLSPVSGFNDTVLGSAGPALREVYVSVEDIDLFTGALCERPLGGAIVGETLACLIGRQFADIKYGDRFFYETRGPEAFTEGQLQYVRQTTLAGLLCANTHTINSVQRNAFLKPSPQNPPVSCSQWRTPVPLDIWREELRRLLHTASPR